MARNEVERLRTVSDDDRCRALGRQLPSGNRHKSRRGPGGTKRTKDSKRRA